MRWIGVLNSSVLVIFIVGSLLFTVLAKDNQAISNRLYRNIKESSGSHRLNITSEGLPKEIQALFISSMIKWRDLSGSLQRLILWDAGYVITHDMKRIVPIYVECGRTMDDTILPRANISVAGCEWKQCKGSTYISSPSSICSKKSVENMVKCAVNASDVTRLKKKNVSWWAEESTVARIMDPDPLLYKVSGHTVSIQMASKSHRGMKCPFEGFTNLIIPCSISKDIGATNMCRPRSTGHILELIQTLGTRQPHDKQETGNSTSKELWILISLLSVCSVIMLLLFFYHKCLKYRYHQKKSEQKFSMAFPSSNHSVPFLETTITKEKNSSVSLCTTSFDPYTDIISTSQVMLNFQNDPLIQSKRIPLVDISYESQVCQGGSGEVFLGKIQGEYVVIKQLIRTKKNDPKEIEKFAMEIQLLSTLNHPNIVQLLGVGWSTFQNLVLVMEYKSKGDLLYVLRKEGKKYTWQKEKLYIATCIAQAIAYLHSLDIPVIHRDIKSRNILMDEDGKASLCDFGLSCNLFTLEFMTSDVGGTILWSAPEIIKGLEYTVKADIYSFGVVLSEIDTCSIPYIEEKEPNGQQLQAMRIAHLVVENKIKPKLSSECPSYVQKLALECMHHEPEKRPSASEILFRLAALSDHTYCHSETSSSMSTSSQISHSMSRSSSDTCNSSSDRNGSIQV